MISVSTARGKILAPLRATGAETVPLQQAAGRVLARAVTARLTQPPADVSSMDGFALRAADALAPRRIIGSAPAGHPFPGTIGAGEAIRIFTGSIMPTGADAVLIQENAREDDGQLYPQAQPQPGAFIRRAGQDFAAGQTLLHPGQRLTAGDLGLAAAANHPYLDVHRRPVVAILATGDEIALPGEPLPPGGIISANTHMLAALVERAGATALILPVAADTPQAIAAAAAGALHADLLLTTGGASIGAHDLVMEGLSPHGFALDFWKIAMRPGKPLISGRIGARPVLGLPGNPVSAYVCAVLFALPAIARLSGLPGDAPATRRALCTTSLAANDQREDYLRAVLSHDPAGGLLVTPHARQDSALLNLLAQSDALVIRAPQADAVPAGSAVDVVDLRGL